MKLTYLAFFLFATMGVNGQNAEEMAVMQPVNQLFTGMNLGDSAMVHRAFMNQVTMATVTKDKEGKMRLVREGSLEGFLKSIGTPRPEKLSEPIWDVKVNIDGNFATVWAQYAFYIGKKFSHCGVDAFHLVKSDDGQWKIFHLADTRRKEGCIIPESVSQQFK